MYILKPISSNASMPLRAYETLDEAADDMYSDFLAIPSKGNYPHCIEYCQQTQVLSVYTDYSGDGSFNKQVYRFRVVFLTTLHSKITNI